MSDARSQSDARSNAPGTSEWSELLEQTRQSLSNLRAEDLDELAARAECMLAATVASNSIRQRMPLPREKGLADLVRQHRLLGDLIAATRSNLQVLRRARGGSSCDARHGEVNSRWVR
jgi:hypothetical protein